MTVGLPGTGLSYKASLSSKKTESSPNSKEKASIGNIELGDGIFDLYTGPFVTDRIDRYYSKAIDYDLSGDDSFYAILGKVCKYSSLNGKMNRALFIENAIKHTEDCSVVYPNIIPKCSKWNLPVILGEDDILSIKHQKLLTATSIIFLASFALLLFSMTLGILAITLTLSFSYWYSKKLNNELAEVAVDVKSGYDKFVSGLSSECRENIQNILTRTPWLGASSDTVDFMLGPPEDEAEQIMKTKTVDTWKYLKRTKNSYDLIIKLEDGIVTKITDKR